MLSLKDRTFERITLEFLSWVKLELGKRFIGRFGTVYFRLFNKDYEYNMEEIGNMFQLTMIGRERVHMGGL